MKTKAGLLYLFVALLVIGSAYGDSWTQLNDFTGPIKRNAASFVINSKGYLCGGYDASGTDWSNDCWEYSPATDTWTQKASLPYSLMTLVVGGAINGKGYLVQMSGTFWANTYSYEYDAATNVWTTKAICPALERLFNSGTIVNNKMYSGFGSSVDGSNTDYADWWEYDPANNSWTQKANFPGNGRWGAAVFAINNKAYAGGGGAVNGSVTNDFYEYNPLTNAWAAKASLGTTGKALSATFVINNRGYVCGGDVNVIAEKELFEYNPATDSWVQKTDFPRPTYASAAFTINGIAYVGLGSDITALFDPVDWYKYTPDPTGIAEQEQAASSLVLYPNPATDELHVNFNLPLKDVQIKIYNTQGQVISTMSALRENTINIENLASGKYFISFKTDKAEITKEFVKF